MRPEYSFPLFVFFFSPGVRFLSPQRHFFLRYANNVIFRSLSEYCTKRRLVFYLGMSESKEEEYVEPEVAALLAATADKNLGGRQMPPTETPSDSLIERRRRQLLLERRQRGTSLSSRALAVATVLVVIFFTYVSMSGKPYSLASELRGSWVAEGQGSVARTQLAEGSRDIEIDAHPQKSHHQHISLDGIADTVIPSKLQKDDFGAFVTLSIGHYRLEGPVAAMRIQTNLMSIKWETVCHKSIRDGASFEVVSAAEQGDGAVADGAVQREVPVRYDIPCSFLLNSRRIVASFHEGGEAPPVVFLLHRSEQATGGSLTDFWDAKGKYLLSMIFLVFFLKGFQMVLDPPRSRKGSLLAGRPLRSHRAAAVATRK